MHRANSISLEEETDEARLVNAEFHEFPRVLGEVRGRGDGPIAVLIGGVHGNEPAGALAICRVLRRLAKNSELVRGRVLGLCGNRRALARGVRFIDEDLNRRWRPDLVASVADAPVESLETEAREQRELLDILAPLERMGMLSILDLHTTSGRTAPFACFGDTLDNRRLALAIPITSVLGLEELIAGTLLSYYADRGHVAVSVEAGAHREPETVGRHAAAIWLALVAMGCLRQADVPELSQHRERLARASAGRPRIVEVRHRHVVKPTDEFEMAPGFSSFMPIRAADIVARDRHGAIAAPESGLMLMPRYQGQGEDGYFIAREVAPAWLGVSSVLRKLRAERLVALLPGVYAHGDKRERMIVDERIARRFAVPIMHLCGYRLRGREGQRLVFVKRATRARG